MVNVPNVTHSVVREEGDVISIEVPRETFEHSALELGEGVTLVTEEDGQISVLPKDADAIEELLNR
jgi:antitoxin component of MazEF toxin-antitoxin module